MGFQTVVNITPAPAVAGDFASSNPRASADAGPGAFVAGAVGCNVGRFAWADSSGLVTNAGSGVPTGFIHRDLQALNFNLLSDSTLQIPEGYPVTVMTAGDFWAVSANAASSGQKVFANPADGSILCDTAGATVGATSFTASIAASVGGAPSVMTVSAVGSGTLVVGQEISGANVEAGTVIIAQLTGTTGSTGTYSVSPNQVAASGTVTSGAYVETKWAVPAGFSCAAGELVKMTSWS